MKKGYWIAAGLAVVFVLLGVTSFTKTLTPYLTFDEARKARGLVQVMGGLDRTSDRYDTATQRLSFDLVERELPVAVSLLRLCAFLAPDDIPVSVLLRGAAVLPPDPNPAR